MKSKLHRIDRGTRYDISGNVRRLARRLESGDLQNVTDIVFVTRSITPPDRQRHLDVFHCGTGYDRNRALDDG